MNICVIGRQLLAGIVLFFLLGLSSCSNPSDALFEVRHVFSMEPFIQDELHFQAEDYFYLYNYTPSDSSVLLRILDTLTVDTARHSHYFYFYNYHESLPDTSDLNKKMKHLDDFHLTKEFGHNNKHLVLVFTSLKEKILDNKQFPRRYLISRYFNGKEDERYYHRSANSFVEVPYSKVFPCVECD
ncbi:hypothetical protein RCC89_14675 [Cytophagaceae bacterium ABcell3]|nr:hypothetical protein RCC89_14675 [Cytophagaceae bacterium ABcell3]